MNNDDELAETRALLRQVVECLKLEAERHKRDIASIRSSFMVMLEHHQKEVDENHELLRQSEERMAKTNEMVRQLSQTCSDLVRVNSELKDSYVDQFNRATSMNNHLIEEAAKMRKENEAYYENIKKLRAEVAAERARYDKMMEQMVGMVCSSGSRSPLVSIDSK